MGEHAGCGAADGAATVATRRGSTVPQQLDESRASPHDVADAASAARGALPAFAVRPVVTVSAAFVLVELAVAARYGFHRDELYFLACARHLAWGYVDQPPVVPVVAWFESHLFGSSVVALRIVPALAGGGAVACSGAMARELGGARKAQTLAALAGATSPQVLAACHLLSTTSLDLSLWAVLSLLVLVALRTGEGRWWLVIGAVAGVALLTKLNVAFFLAALAIGLLLAGRRRLFASPWLWGGAAVAIALWMPNIVWNARHDWAALAMLRSLHAENGGLGASLGFIPSQLVVVGPVLVVFWIAGLRDLLRTPTGRPFGIAFLVLLGWLTVTGAKSYYLAGAYFALFAAGGVWAERRLDRSEPPRGLRGWIALMVAGALVAVPLALPVLPEHDLAKGPSEGNVNKDLSATVGWPAFVGQLAAVAARLPPGERAHLVVFTGDYGAAGAVDRFGAAVGLPHAISGHNSYWWWGPADARDGATTIAVNLSSSYLRTIFESVTPAGTVATPGGVWSEERGDPIWICRGQRITWAAAWPAARHYG
jgi:4-amino-4-deoxy-L-arabinose transferase-like glycosyltransferase